MRSLVLLFSLKSGKSEQFDGFTQDAIFRCPTSKLGNVIVTCSPFPTSRSPSQAVSMDAGLKSSVGANKRKIESYLGHMSEMDCQGYTKCLAAARIRDFLAPFCYLFVLSRRKGWSLSQYVCKYVYTYTYIYI